MTREHTQTLLSAGCEDNPNSADIYAADGSLIAQCFVNGGPGSIQANARRIVACWNACIGLHNEFLEASKKDDYVIRLIWEADAERRLRDELMQALRRIANETRNIGSAHVIARDAIEKLNGVMAWPSNT